MVPSRIARSRTTPARRDLSSWPPAATLLLLLASTLPGCSGSGLASVSGEVTFDGERVERGTVRLIAVDGKTPSAEAIIQDGRYRVEAVPGEKRVEIQGFRVVGTARRNDDPSAPLEEVTEPIIPARFNTHSELLLDIPPRSTTHHFHLTTR
jgi:hypothetical protein